MEKVIGMLTFLEGGGKLRVPLRVRTVSESLSLSAGLAREMVVRG